MKKKFISSVVFLVLFLFTAQTGNVWAQDVLSSDIPYYPVMHPDRETLHKWIEDYKKAPEAFIDHKIKERLLQARAEAAATSVNLLDSIQYTPSERNQGNCGNCWVWAGTGIVEIALAVNNGVKNRLSTQFLNSCKSAPYACCGGDLTDFRDWYSGAGHFIPWSNTNAFFADGNIDPDYCVPSALSCGSISTTPHYPITAISDEQKIVTTGVGQTTAIANVKNILNQKKGVWLGFNLANTTDWNAFRHFWNDQPESTLWIPDTYCGHTWNDSTGGGHAVLIVGYNDEDLDPANHYWIALNSWGTANGRPNGLFRISMQMNYDCVLHEINYPDFLAYQFGTLDVSLESSGVSPSEGTIGTNFTITGSGFGTTKSFVYLEYQKNGVIKQAKPKITSWTDTSITGIWNITLSAGSYKMYVKPKAKGTSAIDVGTFTIKNPAIDEIAPNSCSIGEQNTISGKFFSSIKPKVYFQNTATLKKYSCKVNSFAMDPDTGDSSLQFSVPKVTDLDSGDYNLILQNKIGQATTQPCSRPNLTPYQPSGWSDKIVVSKVSGSTTDSSPLSTTDTLYVDWAAINSGTEAASVAFSTDMYLDGTKIYSWSTNPPLDPDYFTYVTGYSIGSLSAGTHTLKIVTDATHAINESNENDNEYTRTINVTAVSPPSLSPHAGTWNGSIVSFNVSSDHTSLTPTGTSLVYNGNPLSIKLAIPTSSTCTALILVSSTVPIKNNGLNLTLNLEAGSFVTLTSQFSSSTTVSGSYSYTSTGSGCGSGTWNGTWSTNY
jgi:hypothetical protein